MTKWIRYEGGQEIYTVQCPNCKQLLNNEKDYKEIIVDITAAGGSGKLHLSAIWGDYSHSLKDVTVATDEVVEMFCPFCNRSLMSEDICADCGATTTMFGVSGGFIKICNRKGCKMHFRFQLTGD